MAFATKEARARATNYALWHAEMMGLEARDRAFRGIEKKFGADTAQWGVTEAFNEFEKRSNSRLTYAERAVWMRHMHTENFGI